MNYYYLGLHVESPEREQAMQFRNTLLEMLNINMRGKMFVPLNTELLENKKFMDLLAYMSPKDTLIAHDITRSTTNISSLIQIITILHDKGLNLINMAFPRTNTFDYLFLYEELVELLLLTQNYTVFLYHLSMRTLHLFDISKVPVLEDIDKAYGDFIRHTIRNEVNSFGITPTVTEFIDYITTRESLDYIQQSMRLDLPVMFDDSIESLIYFNEYMRAYLSR